MVNWFSWSWRSSMGIAHSDKLNNKKHHVTCILGDGEMNEGSVWEA